MLHRHWRWLRRLVLDERGSYPLEYVGVTAISIVLVGILIAGLEQNRPRIGATMAQVLERIIISLDNGHPGTLDYDLEFTPTGREPNLQR